MVLGLLDVPSSPASYFTFPISPSQVQLLNMEHNPDIMLLAARAMTFMADALPASCSIIVRHGAVPIFCARLLTIEYIDLAEQSLQVRGGACESLRRT